MAEETKKYNEDYLNGLIAKAKKSWEGVDVDSFMSELRDNLSDKEVAEKLSKEVTSHIIEQIKSNMNTVTVKCRDLMVGDFVCLKDDTKYELPLKVDGVLIDDISLEGEGFLGGFDGLIRPIPITPEILEKNGWKHREIFMDIKVTDTIIFSWTDMYGESLFQNGYHMCDCKYVHTLQHAFHLYGFNELADNFKI